MANEEHLKILKKGVAAWNAWRKENPYVDPDLRGADLSGSDLCRAYFSVSFAGDLSTGRVFFNSTTNLSGANLGGADLNGANLVGANLMAAGLSRANLRNSQLRHTDLRHSDLSEADLHNSLFLGTALGFSDLRMAKGLVSRAVNFITHEQPALSRLRRGWLEPTWST